MTLKLITAHEVKPGTTFLIDGHACIARGNDISKTGKHGASKCRIEAIGIDKFTLKFTSSLFGDRFGLSLTRVRSKETDSMEYGK